MITKIIPSEKSVGFKDNDKILCCYTNTSSKTQIIQIRNIPNFNWESVVFSNQRLMFEAVTDAKLEVITGSKVANAEVIPCQQLKVKT